MGTHVPVPRSPRFPQYFLCGGRSYGAACSPLSPVPVFEPSERYCRRRVVAGGGLLTTPWKVSGWQERFLMCASPRVPRGECRAKHGPGMHAHGVGRYHAAGCLRRCRRLVIRFQHPPSVEGRKGGPPSDINRSVRCLVIRLHPNLQWGRLRVPSGCQVGCMKALEASSYRWGWRGDSGVPVTPAWHGRKTALRSPQIAENRGKSPTAT